MNSIAFIDTEVEPKSRKVKEELLSKTKYICKSNTGMIMSC